ncbi:hypothetical protein thsrh120_31710 [Rhizobium sp. No.120]
MVKQLYDIRIRRDSQNGHYPGEQVSTDVDIVLHNQGGIEIALKKSDKASNVATIATIFSGKHCSAAVPGKALPVNVEKLLL